MEFQSTSSGAGTERVQGARETILLIKGDLNTGLSGLVVRLTPFGTERTGRASDLFVGPIDVELGHGYALGRAGLPTGIGRWWTQQVNVIVHLGVMQERSTDIGRIDHMLLRE